MASQQVRAKRGPGERDERSPRDDRLHGAIQKSRRDGRPDCFVAFGARNDDACETFSDSVKQGEHGSAVSRHDAPELCQTSPSKLKEGAGKAGCWLHPWPACNKKARGGHHRFNRIIRPSLRDGFNGVLRAPWGPGSLAPITSRSFRSLGISVGMPGPHDFLRPPRRRSSARHNRARRQSVHRIPVSRVVTIAIRTSR